MQKTQTGHSKTNLLYNTTHLEVDSLPPIVHEVGRVVVKCRVPVETIDVTPLGREIDALHPNIVDGVPP